jgi:hypothetical protein
MSRTIHGLVAVTAVVLAGLPLSSSAASATATVTDRASAAAPQEFDEDWGPYYSLKKGSYRAKASGSAYEDGDSVHVKGRIYDKHSSVNICGYIQTKFVNEDDETRYYRLYNCVYGTPLPFDFSWDDVSTASVRVCLWNQSEGQRLKCGQWYEVYSSDNGDDEGEDEDE